VISRGEISAPEGLNVRVSKIKKNYLEMFLRSSAIREEMCRDERANVVPCSYFCHGLRDSVLVPNIPAAPVFAFTVYHVRVNFFGFLF